MRTGVTQKRRTTQHLAKWFRSARNLHTIVRHYAIHDHTTSHTIKPRHQTVSNQYVYNLHHTTATDACEREDYPVPVHKSVKTGWRENRQLQAIRQKLLDIVCPCTVGMTWQMRTSGEVLNPEKTDETSFLFAVSLGFAFAFALYWHLLEGGCLWWEKVDFLWQSHNKPMVYTFHIWTRCALK
jgi:hypothetical protein